MVRKHIKICCGMYVRNVCIYVCTVCMYACTVCMYSVYVYSVYVYGMYVCTVYMYGMYVCTVCIYRGGSRIDCRGVLSIPRALSRAKFYVLRPLLTSFLRW